MKLKIITCIAALFTCFNYEAALACSCATKSVAEEVSQSELVFFGRAVLVNKLSANDVITTFKIDKIIKGEPKPYNFVDIYSGVVSPACGIEFDIGKDYLIFTYLENGELFTNSCTLSAPISESSEVLRQLK